MQAGLGMRIADLGQREYLPTLHAMQAFTRARDATTPDELWLVEHPPVFTQGLAGRVEHVLRPGGIPVVQTDRGGQVTYHGPGQAVAYTLVDMRRLGIYVKEFVFRLERAVIDVLAQHDVVGHRVRGAPGIYARLDNPADHARLPDAPAGSGFAGLGKIAALGLKVSNHRCYHGVALNVAMDLDPFSRINPCGYAGLRTIDLATLGVHVSRDAIARQLAARIGELLAP